MIRYFCDKCEKEILLGQPQSLYVRGFSYEHLCDKCFRKCGKILKKAREAADKAFRKVVEQE